MAHHLSRIRTFYRMIKKHPQNGSSKGIPTFLLASGLQWWRSIILKLTTVPVPVHSMEMFYNSEAEPDRELLKLPILGYVQAK